MHASADTVCNAVTQDLALFPLAQMTQNLFLHCCKQFGNTLDEVQSVKSVVLEQSVGIDDPYFMYIFRV